MRAIPRQTYAPGSTVHTRFRQWVASGLFEQAWRLLLEHYDLELGIEWKWQALSPSHHQGPNGGRGYGARALWTAGNPGPSAAS